MSIKSLYKEQFSELHTNMQQGRPAPHKSIMLLTVIDLISDGVITSPRIYFTDTLIDRFKENWLRYVGHSEVFNMQVTTPFVHLRYEPFWQLPFVDANNDIASKIPSMGSFPKKFVKEKVQYAELDHDLYELLQDITYQAHARAVLIGKYLWVR